MSRKLTLMNLFEFSRMAVIGATSAGKRPIFQKEDSIRLASKRTTPSKRSFAQSPDHAPPKSPLKGPVSKRGRATEAATQRQSSFRNSNRRGRRLAKARTRSSGKKLRACFTQSR